MWGQPGSQLGAAALPTPTQTTMLAMTPAASPPVGSAEATTPTPPLADLTVTTGPWMKTTFELACHYFVVVEEGPLLILSPAPHRFRI